jgi:protein disulfide-isomerase A6
MRSYASGRTSDAFLAFLNDKVAGDKGFARIESLDALASSFLTAADRSGAAAAIKAAAEKLGDTQQAAGALYSKFAEKASTKAGSTLLHCSPVPTGRS